ARAIDAREEVEDRRLAGAVRPEEAHHPALGEGEAKVAHGGEAAEGLRDGAGFEEDAHVAARIGFLRALGKPRRRAGSVALAGRATSIRGGWGRGFAAGVPD